MGYYSRFTIETFPPTPGLWVYRDGAKPELDTDCEDEEEQIEAQEIYDEALEYCCTDDAGWWDSDDTMKWYDCHKHLLEASIEYPDIVIQLDREGESSGDIERAWYSNGSWVQWVPRMDPPKFRPALVDSRYWSKTDRAEPDLKGEDGEFTYNFKATQ